MTNMYSQSKTLATQAVLDAVHNRGLNACVVHPSGIMGPEDFAVGEDGITLSAAQIESVENALAERDKRNEELAEQVAAMKAAPAEKSNSVVETSHEQNEPSQFEGFVKTVNTAKELFNMVP